MLNNMTMLKKFLMGFIALFFILTGSLLLLMGYVFNNPGSVFNAFTSVTDKILQAQKYEATDEFFLQGIQTVTVSSRHGDIQLLTHTGPTLKVRVSGQVPRFESGPFLAQRSEGESLHLELHEPMASQWIQMNINGQETTHTTDSHLKIEVYLPRSYKKSILLESQEGSLFAKLPASEIYEVEIKSESGKIENLLKFDLPKDISPENVGKIEMKTISGDVHLENQ